MSGEQRGPLWWPIPANAVKAWLIVVMGLEGRNEMTWETQRMVWNIRWRGEGATLPHFTAHLARYQSNFLRGVGPSNSKGRG